MKGLPVKAEPAMAPSPVVDLMAALKRNLARACPHSLLLVSLLKLQAR